MNMSTVRHAVIGTCQGASITLLLAFALPCAAWPATSVSQAAPKSKPAACKNVRFEDGTTARVRVSLSGSWSRCEYAFDLRLKAGAGRKPLEIRAVTPDRCLVWVSESALAKDGKLISRAWDLCVDASHAAAEKEVAKR